ncbi:MAG: hypothetical protein HY925_03945 [Elusimicrobia bacterium]|nr:hypothetical protein [Elusimicrobiota bacterium]
MEVWVQDEGVGIAKEDLSRLFREFSTAGSRPTAGETSHGLGLAIARRIVDLHGGELTVESEPGAGSRFTFRLSFARKQA